MVRAMPVRRPDPRGVVARDAGKLKVIKVNVDDNPALAMRFGAQSIPTLVVLRDGHVVDRVVGALPKDTLEGRLAPHLKKTA